MMLWLGLLTLVLLSGVLSLRSLRAVDGDLQLREDGMIVWQGQIWRLMRRPWMLSGGLLLGLITEDGTTRRRLWVAADSLAATQWRDLRRLLKTYYQ